MDPEARAEGVDDGPCAGIPGRAGSLPGRRPVIEAGER